MNQKRITNQILEQKDFTLNSTLNYLFNISNMKKLFSYLLISSMVVLSSCTNYDDQFDDLNTQINSLKSQIEGFSSLSSGLTALQGTVAALSSAVNALPKTATPATDVSGLETAVAALQAQLANAATSAQVAAIKTDLAATQAALEATIATNATDLTALEAAVAALENTDLSDLEAAVAGLKTALASAATSAEITALETSIAAAQTAIDALENVDLSDLTASVAALENTDLTAVNTAIAELKASLALLENTDVSGIETSVAALNTLVTATQASIAANATAIGANATNIDALATSLAALSATIAELKATLATVSTAEEVSALAADLVAAQADLDVLLAQSSFYEGELTISTPADLTFVNSLGNKINIIKGSIKINHGTDLDSAVLQTVMSRITNVTVTAAYAATSSATTSVSFTNLIGAGTVSYTTEGDVSFAKLSSASTALQIDGGAKTATVSLPELTSVKAAGLSLTGLGEATTLSIPKLVEYDGAITVAIDPLTGTVDLSTFENDNVASTGAVSTGDALTITAATLTAPVYAVGVITGNTLTSVDLPKWKYKGGSSFAKAKTVSLPSVDPGKADGAIIGLNTVFPLATSISLTSAASTKKLVGTAVLVHNSVTATTNVLESLTLGGTFKSITVSGTDLTSLTFDGTAASVSVTGTDIESLDIPYTSAAKGSLTVQNNSKLTSLTASKVDGLVELKITGNTDLTSVSMAALKTAAASTSPRVFISNNQLAIENVQIPSPTVAHKIESVDFTPLAAFLTSAVSKIGVPAVNAAIGTVSVSADIVSRVTSALGVPDNTPVLGALAIDSGDTGSDADVANNTIVDYEYLKADGSGAIPAQKSFIIENLGDDSDTTVVINGANVSLITDTGLDDYFDVKAWAENATTTSQLDDAGYSVTFGKGKNTAELQITSAYVADAVVTFNAGMGNTISIITAAASTMSEVTTQLSTAINAGSATASKFYSAATGSNGSASTIKFTALERGSAKSAFSLAFNSYNVSLVGSTKVASTTGTPGFTKGSTGSIVEGANVEDTNSAWVTFLADTPGVVGDLTVTIIGGTQISTIAASGINQGATETGDDEAGVVLGVNSAGQTNANTIAQQSVNFASKLQ